MLIEMPRSPGLEQLQYFLERNGIQGAKVTKQGIGATIELTGDCGSGGYPPELVAALRRHCSFSDLFSWVPAGLHDVAFWDKPERWQAVMDQVRGFYALESYDAIATVEARGFALAAVLAFTAGKPMIPVRKFRQAFLTLRGKRAPYINWRGQHDELWLQELAGLAGRRVLFFDDVLETGNSLSAATSLLTAAGARATGAFYLLDASMPGVRARFGFPIRSLLRMYDLGGNSAPA